MKAKLFCLLLVVILVTMNSCSSDSSDDAVISDTPQAMPYTYDTTELETMRLINEYRVSIGLNELKEINHISFKAEEHNKYMIANKTVSHNNFADRSENIKTVTGAKIVSENIAYNYSTSKSVLDAWLNSPSHKENIEGNYTHFGISVRVDAEGKKYCTNIFAKL